MSKHTGGSAFPGKAYTEQGYPNGYDMGLTKLEWFTGHALAGMIAGYAVAHGSPTNAPDEIAEEAVIIAECVMLRLAAREVAK